MSTVFDIRDRLARHPMECIPGCTDCCGPVTASRAEKERIAEIYPDEPAPDEGAFDLLPVDTNTLTCAYADGGCRIHSERPILCRMFGVVDEKRLRCPHGRRPRRMVSASAAARMTRRYGREIEEPA